MKRNRKITATNVFGWMQGCMFLLCLALAPVFFAHAESPLSSECVNPPPNKKWNEQEKWIWQQVCSGHPADLATKYSNASSSNSEAAQDKKDEGSPTKEEADQWLEQRTVSFRFLEDLLLTSWSSKIQRHGINIRGAKFKDVIDLENASLQAPLSLTYCYIANEIKLHNANIDGELNLDYTTVDGKLGMSNMTVKHNVFIKGAHLAETDLSGAKIDGQLILDNAKVDGELNMENANVKQGVYLEKAITDEISLGGAVFDDELVLTDAEIYGKLNLVDATVKNNLNLSGTYLKEHARLIYLSVGSLTLGGDYQTIDLSGAHIIKDLMLRRPKWRNWCSEHFKQVDNNKELQASVNKFKDDIKNKLCAVLIVRLKSAPGKWKIAGFDDAGIFKELWIDDAKDKLHIELVKGSNQTEIVELVTQRLDIHRRKSPQLILRNVKAGGLHDGNGDKDPGFCDGKDSDCRGWPVTMDLNGFKFTQLGALNDGHHDISRRGTDWWKDWLKRNINFSPQPYQNLAGALKSMGREDEANDILFAGKNAESDAIGFPGNIPLWFQWALTGYGYHMLWSIGWILFFVSLGVGIMQRTDEAKKVIAYPLPKGLYQHKVFKRDKIIYWSDQIAYSFDMLLPIITLREAHFKIDLQGGARYYFYFHRLFGWVLGGFLAAGISGLTN